MCLWPWPTCGKKHRTILKQKESAWLISVDSKQLGNSQRNRYIRLPLMEPFNCWPCSRLDQAFFSIQDKRNIRNEIIPFSLQGWGNFMRQSPLERFLSREPPSFPLVYCRTYGHPWFNDVVIDSEKYGMESIQSHSVLFVYFAMNDQTKRYGFCLTWLS